MLIFNAKQDYLKSGSLLIPCSLVERFVRSHINFEANFRNECYSIGNVNY